MGLFDMFKKVTFDEAVNMVLTNTVPEDEKGFNRFFKPISDFIADTKALTKKRQKRHLIS